MISKLNKTIVLGIVMAMMAMTPLNAVVNSASPFKITDIPVPAGVTLVDAERHNPLYGLFGAGHKLFSPTEEQAAFEAYYDFCKGAERGLETSTDLTTTSAKANFNRILKEAAAVLSTADTLKISVPAIEAEAADPEFLMSDLDQDSESANRDRVFEMWKDAQLCTNHLTYTNVDGEGIATPNTYEEGTYALVSGLPSGGSVVGSGSTIRHRQMDYTAGGTTETLHRMCYEDAVARDRDIALLFSDKNTAVMSDYISKLDFMGGDAYEEDALDVMHLVLFSMHAAPSEINASHEMFIQSNDGDIHINQFKIRPWNTLDTNHVGAAALVANTDLNDTGLGFYCDQIKAYHDDTTNQINASNIEDCVKGHIEAVVNNGVVGSTSYSATPTSGGVDKICTSDKCVDVVTTSMASGISLPGYVETDIYKVPSFEYCSHDDDQDGFLESGAVFDWGTLNQLNDTPYTNNQSPRTFDACDFVYSLQAPTSGWYLDTDGDGVGDPTASEVSLCSDISVPVVTIDTNEAARLSISSGAGAYSQLNTDECPSNDQLQLALSWYLDADDDSDGAGTIESLLNCVHDINGDALLNSHDNYPSSFILPSSIDLQNNQYSQTNTDECPSNDALQSPVAIWYPDTDGDGVGDAGSTAVESCEDSSDPSATIDINGTNHYLTNPDACPNNDQLQLVLSWYLDEDGDSDGSGTTEPLLNCVHDTDSNNILNGADTYGAGIVPSSIDLSTVQYSSTNTDACPSISTPELSTETWYEDSDDDSYGAGSSISLCVRAADEVTIEGNRKTIDSAGISYSTVDTDAFPSDPNEHLDSDNDGLGDVADACDTSPDGFTSSASTDGDSDGCRDSDEDTDDDNDGLSDSDELSLGTSPSTSDTDGDGTADGVDVCPLEETIQIDDEKRTWYPDTDSDGYGAGTAVQTPDYGCSFGIPRSDAQGNVFNTLVVGTDHFSSVNTDECPDNTGLISSNQNLYVDNDRDGTGGVLSASSAQGCRTDLQPDSGQWLSSTNTDECDSNAALTSENEWYLDTDSDGSAATDAIVVRDLVCVHDSNSDGLLNAFDSSAVSDVLPTGIDLVVTHYSATVTDVCPTTPEVVSGLQWYADQDNDHFGSGPALIAHQCTLKTSTVNGIDLLIVGADSFSSNNRDDCPENPNLQQENNGSCDDVVVPPSPADFTVTGSGTTEHPISTITRRVPTSNTIEAIVISRSGSQTTIDGFKTMPLTETGEAQERVKLLIQATTASPVMVTRDASNTITKYCMLVKGDASNRLEEFMFVIPVTGTNAGIIQSYKRIDENSIQLMTLVNDQVVFGATLNKDADGGDCDYRLTP